MGAIGIEVRECDLENVYTKVKSFDRHIWQLKDGFAERFVYLFKNGKQVPVKVRRVPISEIYPKIKLIFDLKGNVIAERACLGARLRTTKENKWLSVNKSSAPDRTLYLYQLVEGIESLEHARNMLDHFYANKNVRRS